MSLTIPQAPNAGLFKQGYQRYENQEPEEELAAPHRHRSPTHALGSFTLTWPYYPQASFVHNEASHSLKLFFMNFKQI
jgi:hypothetical protein